MNTDLCNHCGLPLVECSAVAIVRREMETYLRDHGYSGVRARERSYELVPDRRREVGEPLLRAKAREIVDPRYWGDIRSDALARRYYDTALECVIDALTEMER